MGQEPHLQPQDDLPFFLSDTSLAIIAATIAISTAHMIIVTIFCAIHANMQSTPFFSDVGIRP